MAAPKGNKYIYPFTKEELNHPALVYNKKGDKKSCTIEDIIEFLCSSNKEFTVKNISDKDEPTDNFFKLKIN